VTFVELYSKKVVANTKLRQGAEKWTAVQRHGKVKIPAKPGNKSNRKCSSTSIHELCQASRRSWY
jgi:hypothetical protein